jgi:hypothetical protein
MSTVFGSQYIRQFVETVVYDYPAGQKAPSDPSYLGDLAKGYRELLPQAVQKGVIVAVRAITFVIKLIYNLSYISSEALLSSGVLIRQRNQGSLVQTPQAIFFYYSQLMRSSMTPPLRAHPPKFKPNTGKNSRNFTAHVVQSERRVSISL